MISNTQWLTIIRINVLYILQVCHRLAILLLHGSLLHSRAQAKSTALLTIKSNGKGRQGLTTQERSRKASARKNAGQFFLYLLCKSVSRLFQWVWADISTHQKLGVSDKRNEFHSIMEHVRCLSEAPTVFAFLDFSNYVLT